MTDEEDEGVLLDWDDLYERGAALLILDSEGDVTTIVSPSHAHQMQSIWVEAIARACIVGDERLFPIVQEYEKDLLEARRKMS